MDEHPETETIVDDAIPAKRSRVVVWILVFTALLIVVPLILMAPYLHHRWNLQSPRPVAVYPGFTLRQEPEFYELLTELDDETPTPIFVKLPDGTTCPLADLPESTAAGLLPKFPERDPPIQTNEYTDARSFLTYRDGKLVRANLHAQSKLFSIGGKAQGPFFALPMSRKDVLTAFGEPEVWEHKATGPPGQLD
jgi:hypothetical protein